MLNGSDDSEKLVSVAVALGLTNENDSVTLGLELAVENERVATEEVETVCGD